MDVWPAMFKEYISISGIPYGNWKKQENDLQCKTARVKFSESALSDNVLGTYSNGKVFADLIWLVFWTVSQYSETVIRLIFTLLKWNRSSL